MTNKQFEVKEYLSSLRFAEIMIKIKLEKIEETRELALRVNQALNPVKVQGGQRKNIVEEVALKVVCLTQQLEKQVDEYRELQKNVYELINSITEDTVRTVMELRYIHFMSWEKIADSIYFNQSHIYRLHNKGLKEIAKIFKK